MEYRPSANKAQKTVDDGLRSVEKGNCTADNTVQAKGA